MRPSIVIVGAGASGSMAALRASSLGADVTLLSSSEPIRSNSAFANQGVCASLPKNGDSIDGYADDIIKNSRGMANSECVRAMCEASGDVLGFLVRMGMSFDATCEGGLKAFDCVGSSRPRLYRRHSITGNRIMTLLMGQIARQLSQGRMKTVYGWEFISPIVDDAGVVRGVVAIDARNMEVRAFRADAVIMCTGGYASLFAKSLCSRMSDGSAMMSCYEKGASIVNPEFIRMNPFGIECFGGFTAVPDALICANSNAFTKDGESRNYIEGDTANLTYDDFPSSMYLDMSDVDLGMIERYFDKDTDFMLSASETFSAEDAIALEKCVHASSGGLHIDDKHATTLNGLFAAGDMANDVYGATALAGNDLTASLFGGHVSAKFAVEYAHGIAKSSSEATPSLFEKAVEAVEDANTMFASGDGTENARLLSRQLAMFMYDNLCDGQGASHLNASRMDFVRLSERSHKLSLVDRSEWANDEIINLRRTRRRAELSDLIYQAIIKREGEDASDDVPGGDSKDSLAYVTKVNHSAEGARFDFAKKV